MIDLYLNQNTIGQKGSKNVIAAIKTPGERYNFKFYIPGYKKLPKQKRKKFNRGAKVFNAGVVIWNLDLWEEKRVINYLEKMILLL